MYLKKMDSKQIDDMLKKMLLLEAKMEHFYSQNLNKILDGTIYNYQLKSQHNKDYLVVDIENGDVFVFDDCNYIKFENPKMAPVSYQKNTNDYNSIMRKHFSDFADYERDYNCDPQNIVDIINFCEDILATKNMAKESNHQFDMECAY